MAQDGNRDGKPSNPGESDKQRMVPPGPPNEIPPGKPHAPEVPGHRPVG